MTFGVQNFINTPHFWQSDDNECPDKHYIGHSNIWFHKLVIESFQILSFARFLELIQRILNTRTEKTADTWQNCIFKLHI